MEGIKATPSTLNDSIKLSHHEEFDSRILGRVSWSAEVEDVGKAIMIYFTIFECLDLESMTKTAFAKFLPMAVPRSECSRGLHCGCYTITVF
jgi:hypothetical protein